MTSRELSGSAQERRRVLISAYACAPGDAPEANAGWALAVAAASSYDTVVITRHRFRDDVTAALARQPELAEHLHVELLDLRPRVVRLKRHAWDLYWYYVLWQRAVGKRARILHKEQPFDVVHHATFANDWLPCGLAALTGVPLVWGPVGGASSLPYLRLRRWLGLRGFVGELVRSIATGIARRLWGDRAARRAALVIAQNEDVAIRFRFARRVVVEPNAALDDIPQRVHGPAGDRPLAIFAGRLIGWKGARLAIEALARPEVRSWRLHVYGEGYDLPNLERLTRSLGLVDRVTFLGHRPRSELLAAFAGADAFLFPSMHDQAGWVVAEASSAGLPVVCLPLGGPPMLAAENAHVAGLDGDVVGQVARQLAAAGRSGGVPHDTWSRDRLPTMVRRWYDIALAETSEQVR